MAISLKHAFSSAKADGTDATLVQPSNWNAEHTITCAAGKVLGRDTSGAGAVQELPIQVDSSGNVGIGTSPSGVLHCYGNAGSIAMKFQNAATGNVLYGGSYTQFEFTSDSASAAIVQVGGSGFLYGGAGSFNIWNNSNTPVTIATNNAEVMRAHASGGVSIGTTTDPGAKNLLVAGNFSRTAPVTKTGDFTLGATENWVICNKSSSLTVTFPAASSWTGREVTIKTITAQTVVSASSNVVPIGSASAGTAILAATAGKWATLVSDGTNWVIMKAG